MLTQPTWGPGFSLQSHMNLVTHSYDPSTRLVEAKGTVHSWLHKEVSDHPELYEALMREKEREIDSLESTQVVLEQKSAATSLSEQDGPSDPFTVKYYVCSRFLKIWELLTHNSLKSYDFLPHPSRCASEPLLLEEKKMTVHHIETSNLCHWSIPQFYKFPGLALNFCFSWSPGIYRPGHHAQFCKVCF